MKLPLPLRFASAERLRWSRTHESQIHLCEQNEAMRFGLPSVGLATALAARLASVAQEIGQPGFLGGRKVRRLMCRRRGTVPANYRENERHPDDESNGR